VAPQGVVRTARRRAGGPRADVSGLEDEYLLCGATPRLLYIKQPAPDREPALADLLERMGRESLGCYRRFHDLDELAELVRDDLALLLSERFDTAAVEPARPCPRNRPGPGSRPRPPR
jgi:hypothetical protein